MNNKDLKLKSLLPTAIPRTSGYLHFCCIRLPTAVLLTACGTKKSPKKVWYYNGKSIELRVKRTEFGIFCLFYCCHYLFQCP